MTLTLEDPGDGSGDGSRELSPKMLAALSVGFDDTPAVEKGDRRLVLEPVQRDKSAF